MLAAFLMLLSFVPVLIQSNPVLEVTAEDRNFLHEAAKNGKIDILVKFVHESKAENPDIPPGN